MNEYIGKVKEALKDPSIEGAEYVDSRSYPAIMSFLRRNPQYEYVSEWHDDLFGSKYFVKVHDKITGEYLKKLLEENSPVKKPTLLTVRSIDDLEVIRKAA